MKVTKMNRTIEDSDLTETEVEQITANEPSLRVYIGEVDGQKYAVTEEAGMVVQIHELDDGGYVATHTHSTTREKASPHD